MTEMTECYLCYAVVAKESERFHLEWHGRLDERLDDLRASTQKTEG